MRKQYVAFRTQSMATHIGLIVVKILDVGSTDSRHLRHSAGLDYPNVPTWVVNTLNVDRNFRTYGLIVSARFD